MKHWYAIYTKGRWEKKVHGRLEEAGIESYCPLNTVVRKWSDREKKVEEPLFKSYVFVRISKDQFTKVLEVAGVVRVVYWLGKPAIIRDREIEHIRKFLGEYEEVEVVPIDPEIKPGTRLRVTSGLMMDKDGVALKVYKNKVEVLLTSIGFKLRAVIEKKRLQKV